MVSNRWQEVVRKFLNLKSSGDEFGADEEEDSSPPDKNESPDRSDCKMEQTECRKGLPLWHTDKTSPKEPWLQKSPQSSEVLLRDQSEALFTQLVNIQDLRIFIGTWNVAGKSPPTDLEMTELLSTKDQVDLYVIGFQEIVPLNAGNVLGAEDDVPAKKWEALIRKTLNNSNSMHKHNNQAAGCMGKENFANTVNCSRGNKEEDVEKKTVLAELAICNLEKDHPRCLPKHACLNKQKDYRKAQSATERICPAWWPDTVALKAEDGACIRIKKRGDRSLLHEAEGIDGETKFSASNIKAPENLCDRKLEKKYIRIVSKQMVGIFLTVWIRKEIQVHVRNLKVSCVGCGFMGYYGNKGSIAVSMSLCQTSFCFVCSHLASGKKEGDELRRNADVREILRKTHFHRSSKIDGEDFPKNILAHDRIIWLGDLNYRLALSDMETRNLVAKEDWRALLEKDQLKIEQNAGRAFQGWEEGSILFPPTYKYIVNSGHYSGEFQNSGEKQRTPAWCDRILWHGKGLKEICYWRGESRFSDHRPVKAIFSAEVEAVKPRKIRKISTIWTISAPATQIGECPPINLEFLNQQLEKISYSIHLLKTLQTGDRHRHRHRGNRLINLKKPTKSDAQNHNQRSNDRS